MRILEDQSAPDFWGQTSRWLGLLFFCGPEVFRKSRRSGDGAACYLVHRETFAPILYAMRYSELDEAIRSHNAVGAGLSSSIFTLDVREAEKFASTTGSDCGIANVKFAPSGAEIGGAFGGEKETGGGREAGSDVWKAYMCLGHQHDQFRDAASARAGREVRY